VGDFVLLFCRALILSWNPAKTVWVSVNDEYGNTSNFQPMSQYSVASVPDPVLVFPASGEGWQNLVFSATYAHPSGVSYVPWVQFQVNTVSSGSTVCFVHYDRVHNGLYLWADGGYFVGPITPQTSATLENSECVLNASSSSAPVSPSPYYFQVNYGVTLKASLIGQQDFFIREYDDFNQDSGWKQAGNWPVNYPVNVVTNLTDFRNCIGSCTGDCVLAPGIYNVGDSKDDPTGGPLYIGRGTSTTPFTIKGGGGPGDTTLVRAVSSIPYIMYANPGTSDVTISNLTFDGNRFGPQAGLSCLPGNSPYWDLDLTTGGKFTVQWVDFINAPATALDLGGVGSSVSLSTFGQGGFGYGPNGQQGAETAGETATRSTAVYLEGSVNGAWYNYISYAGTAGITMNGSGQYAYGNQLFQNRYEISDGSGGGQVALTPASSNGTVAGNVIDGNSWPPFPYPALLTGCQPPASQQYNSGTETYGFGHVFYNNEIEKHTGSGMAFAGSNPTGDITISSANPFDPSDTPRYVEASAAGGIVFLGPNEGWTQPAVGVMLDDVLVQNNAGYGGVVLDGVSNDTAILSPLNGQPYVGFINNSCMSGNVLANGLSQNVSSASWTSLLNKTPVEYSNYRGGTCPVSGSGAQTPAPSHIPGWNW
jgi:hypothetical protein